ncbi:MAG: acylphosphatase [Chloroflexota bacterium]
MSRVRAHVVVTGDVQGVFFRGTARSVAEANGVTGWIRNRPEGSVEGVFEGDETAVRALVDWCQQGPPSAEVDRVDVDWQPYIAEFNRFSVR